MPLETIFSIANLVALLGWAVLLLGPVLPARAVVLPRLVVPVFLATAYVVLVLTGLGEGSGGFSTLDEVAQLFATREVLLAGWLHFLAFDLLVGAWIAQDRLASNLPYVVLVPCLVLTFLLGPAGFLLYLTVKWALSPRATRA